ncbi:Rhomboid family protein [Pseudomonas saponiphila]|jgi:membrane associated rhomboid family serine protease|uniref:Rhomboid family protein n=2 Tax=Pseudomonas saponiphila TaxID=556534 RepID=A0A1H4ZPF5_9PSED|nr:Rhomboid family protein [Pseudomonas saponiphila]
MESSGALPRSIGKGGNLVRNAIRLVIAIAAAMVFIHIVNAITGHQLSQFGLIPRSKDGLFGIVLSPFLHQSFGHLGSNIAAFAVLGALVAASSMSRFVNASLLIILLGGSLVWLFGSTGIHIGASGWVFGLWGYLLSRAYFERNWKSIGVAAVVFIIYGGMVFGLLPASRVSFESHIAGALAGILAAYLHAPRRNTQSA